MREAVVVGVVLFAALVLSCGESQSGDPGLIPTALIPVSADRAHCIRGDETPLPSFTYPGATPVPYPAPRGDRVKAEFDVPVFPGAVELDGFTSDGSSTQMFEAETSEGELFAFFEDALLKQGMLVSGAGHGAAGRSCTFWPWDRFREQRPRPVVTVSTEWVWREGERQSPPPGYQGPGARYAPPAEGKLWFFVITDR